MSGTLAAQLREKGFIASLAVRGVVLKLLRTGQTFNALIELAQPDKGEFRVEPDYAMIAIVHVLRSANTALVASIKVGDVFQDDASNTGYRVQRVENNPASIAAKFHCETYRDSEL